MKIFLTGFMGSGKSYTGQRLSRQIALPHFDLDTVIEANEKKTISKIFEEYGENYFREIEKKYLRECVAAHPEAIISTGGGTACYFDNAEFMLKNGLVVYLETNIDVLVERLCTEAEKRPLIATKSKMELREFVSQKIKERLPYYQKTHIIYEQKTKNQDIASELKEALAQLVGH